MDERSTESRSGGLEARCHNLGRGQLYQAWRIECVSAVGAKADDMRERNQVDNIFAV